MCNSIESKLLPFIEGPGCYTGGELNSIVKNWSETDVKILFSYPDKYEIGMSNLALQIFYHILNLRDDVLLERCFHPGGDAEKILRKEDLSIFSLENQKAAKEFDLWAFTLPTEMVYSNILNMLDLAKIPFYAKDRDDSYPLIIGGGACAFNPEPIAEFFDCIQVGEGEEMFSELVDVYKKSKKDGLSKKEMLIKMSEIEGVYVPFLYSVSYNEDGTISSVAPNEPNVPAKVKRRLVYDVESVEYPVKPVVPFVDVIHDRCVVEIMKGCGRGCRFCHAGFTNRPVRERSADKIVSIAEETLKNTGYEEVTLISLSSSDHTQIDESVLRLGELTKDKKVNLALPSLRADTVTDSLASQLVKVRKSGFTIAPEAGSQKMRDAINKNLTEEQILQAIKNIFAAGIDSVKMYFMIGLPFEEDEDLLAIRELVNKILQISKEMGNHRIKRLVVNTSFFVPKTHTPFQWCEMIGRDEIFRKVGLLKQSLKHPKISFKYHEVETSLLEGIFARGDRRLSKVIVDAHRLGCKMDCWREYFHYDKWIEALTFNGLSADFYAHRERNFDECLPWDHISAEVSKDYLIEEYNKALEAITTNMCVNGCKRCGVC